MSADRDRKDRPGRHWRIAALALALSAGLRLHAAAQTPLPEHPRPDWERAAWTNLNGTWQFQADEADAGRSAGWAGRGLPQPRSILVPFSWASPASGVADTAHIGWYARTLEVPAEWSGRRVFLVVGASDWQTTAWLDGQQLGVHEGGYDRFEFELTPHIRPGTQHRLVLRVDDANRGFKLEGKQGYGNARGIWQTVYLEARGATPLRYVHFTPDLRAGRVHVEAALHERATQPIDVTLQFTNVELPAVSRRIARGQDRVAFDVMIPDARLWSLEDPFLYEARVRAGDDVVSTYFGMREISVRPLPGSGIPYVALNGKPIYLQLALDQAYHPDGFYTFPTDEFTRDEILRAKRIGLNGLREHVKIETPRKLYWADRLGMLIMADVPNSWGEPDTLMRAEIEHALRAMIERDYNHPSIFAWVPFNESWGLLTRRENRSHYLPETQRWVASIYRLAKSLDPTRLVEDNSPCCGRGHTETDINSWHAYEPGWVWQNLLGTIADSTFAGSGWNFEDGYKQAGQPNINSEFGNVWGYEGSTGDVDWSWEYHRAMDAFRRHPRVAGWLYTEHHDVINEWNGYWRFDRSEKFTGFEALAPGMTLADLHSPFYIAVGDSLSTTVQPGQGVRVPLTASFLTDTRAHGDVLRLRVRLHGHDALGRTHTWFDSTRTVPYRPWFTGELEPVSVRMPDGPAVAVLAIQLEDAAGQVLHRNFATYQVAAPPPASVTLEGGRSARVVSLPASSFTGAHWSLKQWNVRDGLKVNGAGSGWFEYQVPWPAGVRAQDLESVTFIAELSAKQLFGKDRPDASAMGGDYMRGRGTFDPSRNPNAYPMTDTRPFPSEVSVRVNGVTAATVALADDPADSRGVLSWHNQKRDRHLQEAGSYGELVRVALPRAAIERAAAQGTLVLRLEVPDALPGGLAVYGSHFGRYPLDPTLLFVNR